MSSITTIANKSICPRVKYFVQSLLTEERKKIIALNQKILPQLDVFQSINGYDKQGTIAALKSMKICFADLNEIYETYGTLANFLTKLKAFQHQIENKIPYMCLIEDDLILNPNFKKFVESHLHHLEHNKYNMLRLGQWGEGYITSLEGAINIVKMIYHSGIIQNIDNQLRENCGKELRLRNTPWKLAIGTNKGDCMKTQKISDDEMIQLQKMTIHAKNPFTQTSAARYVYVQCMAGLVDIFKVLSAVGVQACKGNRKIVLDTRHPISGEGYRVDFWDNFTLDSKHPLFKYVVQSGSQGVCEILKYARRTVYPKKVGWNGLIDYMCGSREMIHRSSGYHDKKTNTNMQIHSWNFRKMGDPDDPTGVIVACTWSLFQFKNISNWLPYLYPCSLIQEKFKIARSKLPDKVYVSIHVRNTDKKSNVQLLIQQYGDQLRRFSGAIHLATDSPETIAEFEKEDIKVLCFTTFSRSKEKSKNLHGDHTLSGTCRMQDAVVDLMLMSSAAALITNSNGGFTKLGSLLQKKKIRFGSN